MLVTYHMSLANRKWARVLVRLAKVEATDDGSGSLSSFSVPDMTRSTASMRSSRDRSSSPEMR